MGSSYLKNHFGVSLTDKQFEDIPYPATELVTHVTLKTVQAGALLGMTFFGPLYAAARAPTRNLAGIIQTSTRFGRNGMIIGVGLGPLLTYLKAKDFKTDEFTDRDFRLRHNRGQVRIDQAALFGCGLGAGIAVVTGKPALFGGILGLSAGIINMSIYNSMK